MKKQIKNALIKLSGSDLVVSQGKGTFNSNTILVQKFPIDFYNSEYKLRCFLTNIGITSYSHISKLDSEAILIVKPKTSRYSSFLYQETFSDFTITVESRNFSVHKIMLAAVSGFFRHLLPIFNENVFKLDGVSAEIFILFLRYVYGKRLFCVGMTRKYSILSDY